MPSGWRNFNVSEVKSPVHCSAKSASPTSAWRRSVRYASALRWRVQRPHLVKRRKDLSLFAPNRRWRPSACAWAYS